MGAIFNPLQQELFYAEKSKGSWLNDKKIKISSPEGLEAAVVAVGIPYLRKARGSVVEAISTIAQIAYAVRHFGAIALDLANVAAGRFDGVFFPRLTWWDIAAGVILIQEAEGMTTDFDKKMVKPDYSSCVAGGPVVHEALISQLNNS
jgi:myo-inositol-1(or 4)-monophosphatase